MPNTTVKYFITGSKILGVIAVAVLINTFGMLTFVFGIDQVTTSAFAQSRGPVILGTAIACLTSILACIFAYRLVDRWTAKIQHTNALPLFPPPKSFAAWLALALLLVAVSLGTLALFATREVIWTPENLWASLAMGVVFGLFPGVVEEFAFRWFIYDYTKKHVGRVWAAAISGLAFGLVHVDQVKDVANSLQIIVAALAVSFLFVAAYEWARSLWAPIILHWVWDIFFLHIGTSVSTNHALPSRTMQLFGEGMFPPYLDIRYTFSHPLLSGGQFGVEGSLQCMAVYAVFAWFLWRGRIDSPTAK